MRRTSSVLVRDPVLALSVLAALALLAPSAEGRIGIPKKVKEAVGKIAEQKAPQDKAQAAPEEPIVFDDVILELNEARITGILGTCKRVQNMSAGRPALVAKMDKANEERGKLLDKHEEKIRADRNKRGEVEACRSDGYQAAQDRKTQEYQARALTDPALRDKYTKLAIEHNAAAAKGDSAAIQRIQEAMFAEVLPSKEDSTKVNQECGPMPPVSPEEKKLDALDKEIASLHEQIRALDDKVAAEQTGTSGLTREQWGMALERIQMFLAAKKEKPKDAPRGFSEEEIEAMEKHLQELKEAPCWT